MAGPATVSVERAQEATRPIPHGREQAWYMLARGRRLAGFTVLPDRPTGAGVVVASPLYAEFQKNYRREVLLAHRLAAAGIAVQRFHYPATGNSEGDPAGIGFDDLSDSVSTASAALIERSGVTRLSYLGTRVGALVAASVAGDRPLALWEPVLDGRRHVDEIFRIGAMHALARGADPGRERARLSDLLDSQGAVDVLGYAVHRRLATDLARVRLEGLASPSVALVVQMGGRRLRDAYQQLTEGWARLGGRVETEVTAESEAWWATAGGGDYFRPEEGRPLVRTALDATVAWFARVLGEDGA